MNGSLLRRSLFPPSDPGSEMRSATFSPAPAGSGRSSMQQPLFREHQEGMHGNNQCPSNLVQSDNVQRAGQEESQRSRLALGSRFLSTKAVDTAGRPYVHAQEMAGITPTLGSSTNLSLQANLSDGDFQSGTVSTSNRLQPKTDPTKSRLLFHARGKSLRQRLDSGTTYFIDYGHQINYMIL